jgi:hypothetical protein
LTVKQPSILTPERDLRSSGRVVMMVKFRILSDSSFYEIVHIDRLRSLRLGF